MEQHWHQRTFNTVTTYASVADIVDEIRVIPPVTLRRWIQFRDVDDRDRHGYRLTVQVRPDDRSRKAPTTHV